MRLPWNSYSMLTCALQLSFDSHSTLFTAASGVAGFNAAHDTRASNATAGNALAMMFREPEKRATFTSRCVERLFKLILHVKQNRKIFTTLCVFYNTSLQIGG